MLAEIDGWFTEGFDTMDLREAEALLQVIKSEQTETQGAHEFH